MSTPSTPSTRVVRRCVTTLRVVTIALLLATITAVTVAGEIHRLWEPAAVWMFVIGFLLGVLTVRRLW
jgi:hypothetical protein